MSEEAKTKKGNWLGRHKVLSVVLGIIVLIIVIAAVGGAGKTNTTNTNSNANKNTAPVQQTTPSKQETKKFNIDDIYAQINTGMTEAQVEQIITQKAINCTETEDQYVGKMKSCTYGNVFTDSGTIWVNYTNGKVSLKGKNQY